MRNLVSLAVASTLLLSAFGARAEVPERSGEVAPGVAGTKTAPGTTDGEVSPDRPVLAKPTVRITIDPDEDGPPHDKFWVNFRWSDSVTDFKIDDITVTGGRTTSNLQLEEGGDAGNTTKDSVFKVEVTTNADLEGTITVTVRAGAVWTSDTSDDDEDDENERTTASRAVDNKKPTLETGTANISTIILTYHELVDLNPNGDPPAASYRIKAVTAKGQSRFEGEGLTPATIRVVDKQVTLTLPTDSVINPGDTVKLTYSRINEDRSLRDSVGNYADTLDDRVIENLRKLKRPGPVRNLSSTATDSSIALDWDIPADSGSSKITGYLIQGAKNNGNFDSLPWPRNQDDTVTAFLHKGNHEEGDIWEYIVSARNAAGLGDSRRHKDTVLTKIPGKVNDLVATADGSSAIDLDWSAPDSGTAKITGYNIEGSPNGRGSWATVATKNDTVTSYKHTGLQDDTTVYYRVRAKNTHGNGPWSNYDSATTARANRAPGAPTALTATARGTSAIDISWTAPSDTGTSTIKKYKIEVSTNGTSWSRLTDKDSTQTTHTHTGLSPGSKRHYRVFAINATDTSSASNADSATTAAPRPPSPPRNLKATADGTNAIDLDWDAPSDSGSSSVAGYKIEASKGDSSSWRIIVADTKSRGSLYEHSGLGPAETWYYRVSAINSDSTSGPSNVSSATTDAAAPSAPRDLSAAAVDSSQIDLAWNPPDDDGGSPVTGYRIEWSPNGTSGWTDLDANTGSTATNHSDTTLSPNTTRHYRVSAINSGGTGPPSNVARATTGAAVAGPPTNLVAEAHDTSRIDLDWDPPDDDGGAAITGYRIEMSPNGTSGWRNLVDDTKDTRTDYSHTGVDPGTTRYYRVSAINSAGTGRPSRSASATTFDVPGEPTGLRAEANGSTQIDLRWSAPRNDGGSPITGYRIEFSDDRDSWNVEVSNTGSTATTYSHTGLSPGTTYYYQVSAINEWGTGAYSAPAQGTTDATVPGPPLNLAAEADGQKRIDLAWDPPADDGGADVTGYRIEVSSNGTTWSNLVRNTGRSATTYAHTGLEPGTTRHYRVSAINSAGTGEPSDTASATTEAQVPGAPTALGARKSRTSPTTQIDLSWTAPADDGGAEITGYRIQVDTADTWEDVELNTNSADTEYTHTRLDPGVEHRYRVRAINAAGEGNWSNIASAATDPTVPDEPTGLAAEADGPTRIDLSWTAPGYNGGALVSGYRIEVSADGGGTWTVLSANTGRARTSFTHTGLEPATTRHYRVSAINRAGTGEPSNIAHATTEATVPDEPTDLAATADGISRIDLAWNAPGFDGGAPVTGYRIEASRTRGASWFILEINTGSGATAYSHTGLDPATRWDYRIRAINQVGWGNPSDPAHATTDPDHPGPPTNLTATADGPRRIDLAWNAPAYTGGVTITGYRIQVSEDGGATWDDLVADTDSDDMEYEHGGLDPASTRHYRVFAINEADLASKRPSNQAFATTDPIAPGAPTDLAAEANGTSRIDLAWNAPGYDGGAEITGYRIEASVDGGIVWKDLVENTRNSRTAYSHTGLDPATTRHYRVSAINRAGTGEPSNVAEATTDATVPDAPTGLTAEADGTDAIALAWDAPDYDGGAAVTGYRIEVSEDGGSSWTDLVADTRSGDTEYSHTGLDPASTRHYRVSAINEIGTGAASNVAEATTDATVPDPPTNLVATASSPTQIDLAWTAPAYDGGAPVTGLPGRGVRRRRRLDRPRPVDGLAGDRVLAHRTSAGQHAALPGVGNQRCGHRPALRCGHRLHGRSRRACRKGQRGHTSALCGGGHQQHSGSDRDEDRSRCGAQPAAEPAQGGGTGFAGGQHSRRPWKPKHGPAA